MKRLALLCVCALVLSGCIMQPKTVATVATVGAFDPEEVSFIHEDGPNTIEGQAFLRQRGGGVVTCAGNTVYLFPAGAYARERVQNIYGTVARPARARAVPDTPDPRYLAFLRETRCDAQGDFSFDRLADGRYFVGTRIVWLAGNRTQGGPVMAPVEVSGGQTVEVILSP